MSYTLGTAAKATGKSKPTIQRAIQSGKISATRNSDGSYLIDPAELHRVYPPVTECGNDTGDMKQSVPQENDYGLRVEIERLQEEREREREQLQETIADLRRRLDESEAERRETQGRLTALLTYQPKPEETLPAATGKGRLWQKLFNR
jgi:excisionase family DNA binding protein